MVSSETTSYASSPRAKGAAATKIVAAWTGECARPHTSILASTPRALFVLRLSAQQVDRMGNQRGHGFQRFHRARRTPRQIQNQRTPPHAAHASAQRGKRSLLRAFAAHALSHATQQAVADSDSSFGRNVARSNPSATRGHHESHLARQPNQHFLNWDGVIWNYLSRGNGEVKRAQKLRHRGP